MNGRREFIKKSMLTGGIAAIGGNSLLALNSELREKQAVDGKILNIKSPGKLYFKPLQEITVKGAEKGKVIVTDGAGRIYYDTPASDAINFQAAGSLGVHQVILLDKKDRITDLATFPVNCKTGIKDEEGEFEDLFTTLRYTLTSTGYNAGQVRRMNGELYTIFSSWFQDHMYAMLGMRYFNDELKTGVDLYTEGQREDGMIHDNYKHKWEKNGAWSRRFDYGNFVKIPEDPTSSAIYVRVPVENMAEFTYMESVYRTWKITGDDDWMKSRLDSMLKAMNYTLTDPYRWSDKFNLTKRGYTIDIWDFQSNYDTRISGDTMRVYLDKSHFGISYADNIRFAQSCMFLSEMLKYAGRKEEAEKVKNTALEIKERIDDLSWNGEFYRHWVPEEPGIDRGFGDVNESKQVTLSNTWILNRGLMSHDKIVSIIKTYQRIKDEMPVTSPGEWYCCYPPFPKGWSAKKWNYMNGGVTTIAAGELSLGCFEHGYEDYGVDILRRVKKLADKQGKLVYGCYKGAIEEEPERSFHPIDLRQEANADFVGDSERLEGVMGWTNEGDNDLHEFPTGKQVFKDIPFDIIDPSRNNRRAVLGLSGSEGYKNKVVLDINRKAGSLYFLHCMGNGAIAGNMTWHYRDGSSVVKYISSVGGGGLPRSIANWWTPDIPESRGAMQTLHTAWTGKNNHSPKVGVVVYGMNNPQPEKEVTKIELEGQKDDTKWMIIGLTLSDKEVYFEPNLLSTIPNHWGAAECMYGLMEGLVGIKNTGLAFNKATLSPRWEFAGSREVSATAKYEASGGYLSYNYKKLPGKYMIEFTGTADETLVELVIPLGTSIANLSLNGEKINFDVKKVEKSEYAVFTVKGVRANRVEMMV